MDVNSIEMENETSKWKTVCVEQKYDNDENDEGIVDNKLLATCKVSWAIESSKLHS